jgi:hypothetical protein
MIPKKNILPLSVQFTKTVSVFVMVCSLLFVNGSNFFVYADHHFNKKMISTSDADEENNSKPIEEKCGTSKIIGVEEDFLKESNYVNLSILLDNLTHDHILAAEKLDAVHDDLDAPPPKSEASIF